jgi:hypothetical protein
MDEIGLRMLNMAKSQYGITAGHRWHPGAVTRSNTPRFTMDCHIALVLGVSLALTGPAGSTGGSVISVADRAGLSRALRAAQPGTTIQIAPGEYTGGFYAENLRGEPGRPIVVTAADPRRPPIFRGGGVGFHLADAAYIELRNLVIIGSRDNGINIDDGGSFDTPAHHILLADLAIREIGPAGNRDGIKLSGVDDFRVEGCAIERWGTDGSGIDMVGCHRGYILMCRFSHGDREGASGVQAKGGSRDVRVAQCRFEHAGSRAVNAGGSTGLSFFRPRPLGYEAKDLTIEDCTFVGSDAPIAFVGVDGAIVRHNTFYRPRRWLLRILQETTEPGFAPCRGGRVFENLIAFRSGEMIEPVNVGPHTAPETFELDRNAWYCLDDPTRSHATMPLRESRGRYGEDPRFQDAEGGDLRLRPGSPLAGLGAPR